MKRNFIFLLLVALISFAAQEAPRSSKKEFIAEIAEHAKRVESSNLQNATFYTHRDKRTFKLLTKYQAQYNPNARKLRDEEFARLSRDAGKNQATSQNTVDMCRSKYKVLDLSPKAKGKKWTDKQFRTQLMVEKLKFSKKRSNQDERDSSKVAIITKNRWYEAK